MGVRIRSASADGRPRISGNTHSSQLSHKQEPEIPKIPLQPLLIKFLVSNSSVQPPSQAPLDLKPHNLAGALSVLAAFSAVYFYFIYSLYPMAPVWRWTILLNFSISMLGFFLLVFRLIPVGSRCLLLAGKTGKDLNKKGTPRGNIPLPESLGVVVGTVYLAIVILFLPFNFTSDIQWLLHYIVGLFSITLGIFVGFVDDATDLPWKVKLLLPTIIAFPLVFAYTGRTAIIIPKPLVQYVGLQVLELGWIYKLYMDMLVVFSPNSVNILAGINGLEVGQSIVVSAFMLIFSGMKIFLSTDYEYQLNHMMATLIVLPFLIVSCALLAFNWYPASVFVGDSYTFFAGTTIAVAGILGHFSETLMVFLLPQILNFLYSCPQLFKIVPCPRHRLPRFDPKTGLLTATKDMNLINLFLRLFGPCSEKALCIKLIIFQIMSCCLGIWLHDLLVGWYK